MSGTVSGSHVTQEAYRGRYVTDIRRCRRSGSFQVTATKRRSRGSPGADHRSISGSRSRVPVTFTARAPDRIRHIQLRRTARSMPVSFPIPKGPPATPLDDWYDLRQPCYLRGAYTVTSRTDNGGPVGRHVQAYVGMTAASRVRVRENADPAQASYVGSAASPSP